MNVDYDVIIAGGGMVGASLALQLSRQCPGMRILVVESFPLPAPDDHTAPVYRPSFDARSTALSYGSRLLLEPLAVWPTLATQMATIDAIHVSERGRFGSSLMTSKDVKWPELGYVIENSWLGNVLLNQLNKQEGVECCSPASVSHICPFEQGVEVTVASGDSHNVLKAQLIVVADGAQSGLREQLGIDAHISDYQQTAIIANVCFDRAHQGMAFERFTDHGPMALLPLTDSERSEPRAALVWVNEHDVAQSLLNCDDHAFLARLQQRFGHRVGAFTRVGSRAHYPLHLVEAREQLRSGIVVMGNAAHSLHPVAGQGFNLALRDCARLTTLLSAAHRQQQPLGALPLLQTYVDQQQFDQYKTISFSDQVTALFASKNKPLSLLRRAGLVGLDITPPAKRAFIRHAAGMYAGAATGL